MKIVPSPAEGCADRVCFTEGDIWKLVRQHLLTHEYIEAPEEMGSMYIRHPSGAGARRWGVVSVDVRSPVQQEEAS